VLIGKLFAGSPEGQAFLADPSSSPTFLEAYQGDIPAALATIAAYAASPGPDRLEVQPAPLQGAPQPAPGAVDVGCCRFACHCCYLHDPVSEANLQAAGSAAALALCCAGPGAVNAADREGCTALHRLAAAGLAGCLQAFIAVAGERVNYLRRTKEGLNALQLARGGKHAAAAAALERGTEAAAQVGGPALRGAGALCRCPGHAWLLAVSRAASAPPLAPLHPAPPPPPRALALPAPTPSLPRLWPLALLNRTRPDALARSPLP
jgi:hypothetical protein